MINEVWKPIEGTDGRYEVSNTGRVRSKGTHVNKGIHELKAKTNKYGYKEVTLYLDGKKKSKTIHRLVAITYIPNPENAPQVNHIDGDKTNNDVTNLEWCTSSDNIKHAFRTGLKEANRRRALEIGRESNRRKSKPVIVTDEDGNSHVYPSVSEACRQLKVNRSNVCRLLNGNGRRKKAGGYSFAYVDTREVVK